MCPGHGCGTRATRGRESSTIPVHDACPLQAATEHAVEAAHGGVFRWFTRLRNPAHEPAGSPPSPQVTGLNGPGVQEERSVADSVARFTWREAVSDSPCATPRTARRPGRGAPGFPGGVGNGRRMEARQGAIRVFSGTPFPPQRPRPTIPARDRYLPPKFTWPPAALPSLSDAFTHVWRDPRPPLCPDTISLHRSSSRPWRP